jgi:hypothetical protein
MAGSKPSKKKKKHVSPAELRKQQEAQYQRFFYEKLRNLCSRIDGDSLYDTILEAHKLLIYRFRGAPLKVVAEQGAKIHKRMLEALAKTIRVQQQTMTLDVVKGSKEKMTFAEYSTMGMSLEYHACQSEQKKYPGLERFAGYAELRPERELAYDEGIRQICETTCWVFDDLKNGFLYTHNFTITLPGACTNSRTPALYPGMKASEIQREWERFHQQDLRLIQTITVGTWLLDVRRIKINDEVHVATQTGIVYSGNDNRPNFYAFTLSPEDLRPKEHPGGKPAKLSLTQTGLPIYIQQHAINRMKERIGCIFSCFYKSILTQALFQKEIIRISKKRILIACSTNELKIGYFVAEVTEDVVLIRTFLLLTNSGTPEGEKLKELTGLQIADHKYLSIDTLQGLANSDIEQNEAFCNLMRTAGCGSILELCRKINSDPDMMWLLDKSHPQNIVSDLITEYMKPCDDNGDDVPEVAE